MNPQAVTAIDLNWVHFCWALLIGGLSAISLPLGSIVGLVFKPRKKITGILAAFGSGALIAALTVELVAPTVEALGHSDNAGHGKALVNFLMLNLGAVIGGLLFLFLDQLVNAKGGFLRKTATTMSYVGMRRKKRQQRILEDLAHVEVLRNVGSEHIHELIDEIRPIVFQAGECIFDAGDKGNRLFFIRTGTVDIIKNSEKIASQKKGDVLGEISLLTGSVHTAKAVANTPVEALVLHKNDFDHLCKLSPSLRVATQELASKRLDELKEKNKSKQEEVSNWTSQAVKAIRTGARMPVGSEMKKIKEEHAGAPLAIWLGILLDGIPESFVIGSGFVGLLSMKFAAGAGHVSFAEVVPYTLIAGLFLSNFPEALSSSIGMRAQGWRPRRIILMWTALLVMTCLGSGLGYYVGESLSHSLVIGIEGIAAGAMLTMIASAMIPEAVHLCGANLSGISTLFGFLSAIMFKIFE